MGGAIFQRTGTLVLQNNSFVNNGAFGGGTASPGQGKGGALFIVDGAAAVWSGSSFSNNTASQAGVASIAPYGLGPNASSHTCPGYDTQDVCGPLAVNVTTSIAAGMTGALYSSTTGTFIYSLNLTNIGSALTGPLQLVVTGLPAGVTATGNTGTFGGNPYWTVPAQLLQPGGRAPLQLQFSAPADANFTFSKGFYAGAL